MSKLKKIGLGCVALPTLLAITLISSCAVLSEPRPKGTPGPQAEALADKMLANVGAEQWAKTGAVRWHFPRGHKHLWDRQRNFARVQWDDHDVLINLTTKQGVARTDGKPLSGKPQQELLEKAWALWANDSYWLNPVVKVRDSGTSRELVILEDGSQALLVTYSSGGVTPGDAYLWMIDAKTGRPQGWKMWVSIIPVGGMAFEWEQWQQLSTGAWVAAGHDGIFDVQLEEIKGARTLSELVPGPDPFAELLALSPIF